MAMAAFRGKERKDRPGHIDCQDKGKQPEDKFFHGQVSFAHRYVRFTGCLEDQTSSTPELCSNLSHCRIKWLGKPIILNLSPRRFSFFLTNLSHKKYDNTNLNEALIPSKILTTTPQRPEALLLGMPINPPANNIRYWCAKEQAKAICTYYSRAGKWAIWQNWGWKKMDG
jgi:hypothetical protein